MTETNESGPGSTASTKEKHDFLIGVLKDARGSVVDFMFKQAAILTLVMGWVISSEHAQTFFKMHRAARYAGLIGVIFLCLFLTLWVRNYRNRSQEACKSLVRLGYMPENYYDNLVITNRFANSLIILYSVACVVLLVCLFCVA